MNYKQNKENAMAFYQMAYDGNPRKAMELYVGSEYIQIWPENEEYVTMDFFRLDENGKIIEHWDSMQQIPETSAHNNTMY